MLSSSQQSLPDYPDSSASGNVPPSSWGTWEDLLLASAVTKHGTSNWNVVSAELQARALVLNVSPSLFSTEACKCRFSTLNGRFASCSSGNNRDDDLGNSIPWFEELRKLRVAQLKRELEHYDGSIGSLQRKLKRLKAERAQSSLANKPVGRHPAGHDVQNRTSDDVSHAEKVSEMSPPRERSPSAVAAERVASVPSTDAAGGLGTGFVSKSEDPSAAALEGYGRMGVEAAEGSKLGCSAMGELLEDASQSEAQGHGHVADGVEQQTSSDAQVTDSRHSVESSTEENTQDAVKEDGVTLEVCPVQVPESPVHDLQPVEEQNNRLSSRAGAENDRVASKEEDPSDCPTRSCDAEERSSGEVVSEEKTEAHEGELPSDGHLQGWMQRRSSREEQDSEEGLVTDSTAVRKDASQDATSHACNRESEAVMDTVDCGKVDAEDSSLMATRASCEDCDLPKEKDDEKALDNTSGSSEDSLQPEGLESISSSGANAMDLLRLAYGSAQDITPVSTPEAAETVVESEVATVVESEVATAALELDAMSPTDLASSEGISSLPFIAEGQQSEPKACAKGSANAGKSSNVGSSEESSTSSKHVSTMEVDSDFKQDSGEQVRTEKLEDEGAKKLEDEEAGGEDVLKGPCEGFKGKSEELELSDPSAEASNAGENLNEPTTGGVGEVCDGVPTEGLDLVQSTVLPPPPENINSGEESGVSKISSDTPSVQTRETEPIASAVVGQDNSQMSPGQRDICEVNMAVPKEEEVQDSCRKEMGQYEAKEEIVVAETHDADLRSSIRDVGMSIPLESESGSVGDLLEPDKEPVQKVMKLNRGESVRDVGKPIPLEIKSESAEDVPEHDKQLVQEVMKLNGVGLSNSRKRLKLSKPKGSPQVGSHSKGGFVSHNTPREERESFTDTLSGKQEKFDHFIMEGTASQMEEVSETDPSSTADKEETLTPKMRQFKLRSGRVKGLVKNPERVAPDSTVSESKTLETSERGKREGYATEVFSTRRTRLKQSKNTVSGEDGVAKDNAGQDLIAFESKLLTTSQEGSGILQEAPKTSDEDLDEGMQEARDCNDSHLEKSEVGSPADGTDDRSPMSKRNRREPKIPPKLLPLLECLRVVTAHRFAPLFKQRQESQANARYNILIKRHMDLNIVSSQLEDGMYSGSLEFFRDLLLIFNNALVFYSRDSQEYGAARVLRECVMKEMEKTLQTEALLKMAGRATRKRESKKLPEAGKAGPAAAGTEGKRRGSLRSSSNDNAVCEANLDREGSTRGGHLGLRFPSSSNRGSEADNIPQVKELEQDENKQGVKEVNKIFSRGKTKVKVHVTEDEKLEKSSSQKRKDYKEKNARSLEDIDAKAAVKNEPLSSLELKKAPQIPVKAKEKAVKKDLENKSSKSLPARQATVLHGATRKGAGGRPSRNSQSVLQVAKGNQGSTQSQKRARI